ncbi:MAG: hypothetical protein Q7J80_02770 [Anaerolineales bacterium]|nr:hypothetical protein [Anaerolineales bacterium]
MYNKISDLPQIMIGWFSEKVLIFTPVTLLDLKRHIPYTIKIGDYPMRKSTLFISVVLTTFMLAVLFGVAAAYQGIVVNSTETAAVQPQPTTGAEMVSNSFAPGVIPTQVVPTQVVNLAPEAAADLASKVLGRTDLYSVEVTQFEGVDVYLVTFSSGDLVYLSLDGQFLSISKLPVTVITQVNTAIGGNGGGGNGGGGNGGGGDDGGDDGDDD